MVDTFLLFNQVLLLLLGDTRLSFGFLFESHKSLGVGSDYCLSDFLNDSLFNWSDDFLSNWGHNNLLNVSGNSLWYIPHDGSFNWNGDRLFNWDYNSLFLIDCDGLLNVFSNGFGTRVMMVFSTGVTICCSTLVTTVFSTGTTIFCSTGVTTV